MEILVPTICFQQRAGIAIRVSYYTHCSLVAVLEGLGLKTELAWICDQLEIFNKGHYLSIDFDVQASAY
jgi:hypothetical protein